MRFRLRSLALLALPLVVLVAVVIARGASAENVSEPQQYAWSENLGWINASPNGNGGPGVTVTGTQLSGYMWSERAGWINLNCSNNGTCGSVAYGVTNDGAGNLKGYAWSENHGWV